MALGWDAVLSSTRREHVPVRPHADQGRHRRAAERGPQVDFRNIDNFDALTASSGRDIPTHSFVDDLSWVKGTHTLKFGTALRFSRVGSYNNSTSFHRPEANGSWVSGVGRRYMPGGQCPGVETACDALPAVADGGQATYGDTFIPLLGIISEVDGYYNYDREGNVLPVGEPVRRRFGSDEYEFYVQDSWRIGNDLTVTGGVRYSLYSPPFETSGLQVAPDIKLGDWFEKRRALMNAGQSTSDAPLINFDLAGPKNDKPGYYDWDKNNFAPRFAAAWTPHADQGLWGRLTGNGRLVVRGGYSMVYDRIGNALATNFDRLGSFGLSTVLSSPFGGNNEDEPSIRFQGIDVVPPTPARRAARRIPADAADLRRRHHRGARRNGRDAVQPLVQHPARARPGKGLLVRGRLRRPPRPQPARPARRGDAGQPQGSGVGHRLLHRRRAADPVGAERRASTAAPMPAATPGCRPSRTGRTCSRMRRGMGCRPPSAWRTPSTA